MKLKNVSQQPARFGNPHGGRASYTRDKQQQQNTTMILHTITCTAFVPAYNAYEQFTRHLIRNRRLTERGIERMLRNGCEEFAAQPGINVISVQTAIFCK
jgi:hypothetical protein